MVDDKFEGKAFSFYENGNVLSEGHFKNGLQDGIEIIYNKDGSIKSKEYYENGIEI